MFSALKGNSSSDKNDANFGLDSFEKATESLKTMANSKYSGPLSELYQETIITKSAEEALMIDQQRVQMAAADVQGIPRVHEQHRKSLEIGTEAYAQALQRENQLEEQHLQNRIASERALALERLRREEHSAQRQEDLRRRTLQHEQELYRETEMQKVAAETQGRIMQERVNEDLHRDLMLLEQRERRETESKLMRQKITDIADEAFDFLSDPRRTTNLVVGVTAVLALVFATRASMSVVSSVIVKRMNTPALVRDSSRSSLLSLLKPRQEGAPKVSLLSRALNTMRGQTASPLSLTAPVLNESERERLSVLSVATRNSRKNAAPLRNVLLYGPPGTGKTMFAKDLAKNTGMDYAIIAGGDILPLGGQAVTELHDLFAWADRSKKGTIIFIDEAEAFLRRRDTNTASEDVRAALNTTLALTGENSQRHMLILATNQPSQLDAAILDRMDELVHFDLPEEQARREIFDRYYRMYVTEAHTNNFRVQPIPKGKLPRPIDTSEIIPEMRELMLAHLTGLSGRAISKFCSTLQARAYATPGNKLTRAAVEEVLDHLNEQEGRKLDWGIGEESDVATGGVAAAPPANANSTGNTA